MIHAFVDESGSNHRLDPYAYLLGAAVLLEDDIALARAAMEKLKLPGQRKLHWRDEDDRRQLKIIETIAGLPMEAIVVAHVDAQKAPEQRRHRTMATLLPHLHELGTRQVDFESRGPKDDARDRRLFDDMRRSWRFDPQLPPMRIDHPAGPSEPALWIADAVCGAVVARRTGDDRFSATLASRLMEITCP